MHLIAYTDYVYREHEGRIYSERAFAVFLAAVGTRFGRLTIVGRLDPTPGRARYPLPAEVEFVSLPHYESLVRPWPVALSLVRSLRRFWCTLEDADAVWILGPYPHAIAFATLALVRRRSLVLGVRQDWPQYVRSRRPGRRLLHAAADVLEGAWRLLARRAPVVVVGDQLAANYAHAPAILPIAVSLVSGADVVAGRAAAGERSYDGPLRLLSIGRLDPEKNPLLLADVFARLREGDARWSLVVCGEGSLADALGERLRELGAAEHADLRGYVPLDGGLLELYRSAHVFLHVSLTEGVPQVLVEAFASGVPVVATDVGGVAGLAQGASLLVPPREMEAAAVAVRLAAGDPAVRRGLIKAGFEIAERYTLEHESDRVARFIAERARRPTADGPPRSRVG